LVSGQEANTTILVVEDDRGTREALCEILNDAGYPVLPAENGLRALDTMANVTPALILLDLGMPVMDGLTFLSLIRQHSQHSAIPVIVMTGDLRAPRLRSERPGNVMEVLPKPIDVRRMMALIKQHAGPMQQ
jgi:CheY-like chemotaxis protein